MPRWDEIKERILKYLDFPINPHLYNAPHPLIETLLHAVLGLAAQYLIPEPEKYPYTVEQIQEILRSYVSPPESPTHPCLPPMFYLIPPTPQFTDEGRKVLNCPRFVLAVSDFELIEMLHPWPPKRQCYIRPIRTLGYRTLGSL